MADFSQSAEPPALSSEHALFLDFDGTLVEIAPTPDQIEVGHTLGRLLASLSAQHDGAVAVVSGRALDDLERRLEPFAGILVGLHGTERRDADGTRKHLALTGDLAPARALLAEFAADHPAVYFEDKGNGLALHFRQAPQLKSACLELAQRAAALAGADYVLIGGKMLIELRASTADKGRAIAELLAAPPFLGRVPVFIGDDRTDEDGFAVVNERHGISIAVGAPERSLAPYRIATVEGVLAWLAHGLAHGLAPGRARGASERTRVSGRDRP